MLLDTPSLPSACLTCVRHPLGDTTMTQYDLFSNLGNGIKREDYVHIVDEYWVD